MQITLRAARINAGLSREKAAKLIGVSSYTIANWETGKSYPSTKILPKVLDCYEIDINSLKILPQNNALSVFGNF